MKSGASGLPFARKRRAETPFPSPLYRARAERGGCGYGIGAGPAAKRKLIR